MSDPRLTPFSGRMAHVSLRGLISATAYTEGEAARVAVALAPLLNCPGGAVDRQLLWGDGVTVIDQREGHAFVMAAKDGYCGWLAEAALADPRQATHRVISPATHLYPDARVQAPPLTPLYLNALVTVSGAEGAWARTPEGLIPAGHLAPLDQTGADPVALAESLLHSPYLWGGNSAAGIDCSGLVQMAFHAAGRACPADSDLQRSFGSPLPETADLRRGDLLFWKGHVAIVSGSDQIIHANGYTMSVAYEKLSEAVSRIERHYGGKILARRRP
ncbi:NlpC/P60 family protein [Pseudogemmobacter faecipullorum]